MSSPETPPAPPVPPADPIAAAPIAAPIAAVPTAAPSVAVPWTVAATAAATPPVVAPGQRQPYLVANVVVLALSGLLFIGFWVRDAFFTDLFNWSVIVGLLGLALAIGLFVASLVLRSKTKRAGGKQGIAIAAIVLSSINLLLIVAGVAILLLVVGLLFWGFGIGV